MKKFITFILFAFIAISFPFDMYAEETSVKVIINGIYSDIRPKPIIKDERLFVPLSIVGQKLGCNVDYFEDNKSIYLRKDDIELILFINSSEMIKNGEKIELDTMPFIDNNRIFVPVRFISENLNEQVKWDGKNKIAVIGKYNGGVYEDETYECIVPDYDYILHIPKTWYEKAVIKIKDGIFNVYEKTTLERFEQDNLISGPVFCIKVSDYPICATVPYEKSVFLLDYSDGKYIEADFDTDFQYYPETLDKFKDIYDEGKKVITSFEKL